jgi:hypothetical protein
MGLLGLVSEHTHEVMAMAWLIGLALLLTGVTKEPSILTVRRASKPPSVDGCPNDVAWRRTEALPLHHKLGGGTTKVSTIAKMCFDANRLFILFVCDEPQPSKMRRFVRRHDGEVWTDDCVEVFLAPDPDEPTAYYHLVVNSLAIVRDEFWRDDKDDPSWDSHAQVAVRIESNRWVVEIAIPFASFNRTPIVSDIWRVNFARQRYTVEPAELSTWRPCQQSFHEPERFGALRLEGVTTLPVVRRNAKQTIEQQAAEVRKKLERWRMRLPEKPQTEVGRQVLGLIAEWRQRLRPSLDLTGWWRQLRVAKRLLPRWEAMAMRAQLSEQLRQPYALFALSPMTKLRPEEMPTGKPLSPQNPVTLLAARGEGESVQIAVTALEQPLRNVKVSVTPLVGPKGTLIFPELKLVGYVPVQKPTPGGFGIAGRYPDPLLPLRPFDVPQGEHRCVWLTVWVPQKIEADSYEGAIIVEPENAPNLTVPVRLRVFAVDLPKQSFLKTCVLIWDYKAKQVYGDAWTPERSRRFYEQCLRYRFTPPPPLPWDEVFVRRPDGTWAANWDEFDRVVETWMAKGATAFSIGGILHWGTKLPPENERDDVAVKLRFLGEHLRQKGWSERFYFYVFDEPSTAQFANIEALCRFVHEHAPNLNILLTAGYGATGPFRTHAPTPEGAAYRVLANFINIWVPHIDCFDEPFLRERKKAGDQVWMYVCISTVGKTYPDIWRIDWTGTAHRAIGWWLWRYGCDGFLYWCVNYWTDDKGKPFDLFANPTAYPGGNGDGFLFYPDPQRGDPLPSVRAEIFRDGIEDYDLLCLLQTKVTKAQKLADLKRQKWLQRAQALLRADDLILAPNKFVDNPVAYEQRHRQLLEVLEEL